jgi:hypothetical protein
MCLRAYCLLTVLRVDIMRSVDVFEGLLFIDCVVC